MQQRSSMQRSLWKTADRFRATFPDIEFNPRAFGRIMARMTRQPTEVGRMASLAFDLLAGPPVQSQLLAFVHDQLAEVLVQVGNDDPESEAASILANILRETPAFGLEIAIAAARRGGDVAELSRYDTVIANLHLGLRSVGARPIGPQEHPETDADADHVTGNQWEGHLRTNCIGRVEHDLLVVLAGRSVGIGEAVSTARRLRIPVIVAELTDTVPLSCRLVPDGDLLRSVINVPDDELPALIVEQVVFIAEHARTEQRLRVKRMIESQVYRSYLTGQPKLPAFSTSARGGLFNPLRFLSLSTPETAYLARELDAFEEIDFLIYNGLHDLARDAYDHVADGLARELRVELLRVGSRSIVTQASDPRDQRRLDWSKSSTWSRLLDKLQRSR